MRKVDLAVPVAAACGALLCFALPGAGRLASTGGAPSTAAPDPGLGRAVPGVAVATAVRAGGTRTLGLPGRVALDETRVYRVDAGVSGSIRDVPPLVSGSRVRRNQVLGSFAAPEAISAAHLLLIHDRGFDPGASPQPPAAPGVDASRRSSSLYQANVQKRTTELESMGVAAGQRAEIARDGRIPGAFRIVSPADGVVLERNVSPGLEFERGYRLYTIADLRRVWIVADVFPDDARYVRPGLPAEVAIPELDVHLPGTIDRVLPEVDPVARTTRVRLELENPGEILLPGMFVDVRINVDLPPAVVVPAGAVLGSGGSETVYVRSAGGAVEPRRVTTGWRSTDRVEIVEGLAPNETVVAAPAFLLDSETRLRAPAAGPAGALADGS